MVFVNVRPLLIPVFFRNDQIDIANGFYQLFAFFIGKIAFFSLFIPVKLIRGYCHNQIIAQRLGTAEQIDMSVVEQIEGSVGNNTLHKIPFSFLCCSSLPIIAHPTDGKQ